MYRFCTTRVVPLLLILAVLLVNPGVASAVDYCYYNWDSEYVCFPPSPVYGRAMNTQPDWCNYTPGDVVWKNTHLVNGQLVTTQWFAYPHDDVNRLTPPSCCSDGAWYVDNYCGLFFVW